MTASSTALILVIVFTEIIATPTVPPPTQPPFTDKDFLIRPDALLVPLARKAINSDYVTLTKGIDFSNLHEATDYLGQLTTAHAKVCQALKSQHAQKGLYTLLDGGQGRIRSEAAIFCNNLGMTLARPNTYAELMELRNFMLRNHLREIISDAAIPYSWDKGSMASQIKYPDGSSPFVTATMYWAHTGTLQHTASYSQQIVFRLDSNQDITIAADYEKTLPAVCQTKPEKRNLDSETAFCDARTNDLANANQAIIGALDELTGTMPIDMATFDNSVMSSAIKINITESNRQERSIIAAGAAAFAAITLLATTATAMANSARTATNTRNIASLHVDTTQIKKDFEAFAANLNETMIQMQTEDQLILHETRIFAAATNVKLGLQDNVVVFVHVMQTINYSQYSPLILSPAELARLQTTIFHQTSQKLSQHPTDYTIYPVLVDGRLGVNIEIPLLDHTRDATIFEVVPVPSFTDGRKVILDCDQRYVAMYEHSKTYNPMNENEVTACITSHKTCLARTPILDYDVDNCAARQFTEDHPVNSYRAAPDSTPFFHTINNVTIYSVPKLTRVDFHCPDIDRPGSDLVLNISARGYFVNPMGNCRFTTQYSEYTPPIEKYSLVSRIKELFTTSLDPNQYNFPTSRTINIPGYKGQYQPLEIVQATGSYGAIVAVPTIIVALAIISILLCRFSASKRRLKFSFKELMTRYEPDRMPHRMHHADLDAELQQFRYPTSPASPNPDRKNIFVRSRPERASLPKSRALPRHFGYLDRFELAGMRPIYPELSRANSDRSVDCAYRNVPLDPPPVWSAPKTHLPIINPPDKEMNRLVPRPATSLAGTLAPMPPHNPSAPDDASSDRSDDAGTNTA